MFSTVSVRLLITTGAFRPLSVPALRRWAKNAFRSANKVIGNDFRFLCFFEPRVGFRNKEITVNAVACVPRIWNTAAIGIKDSIITDAFIDRIRDFRSFSHNSNSLMNLRKTWVLAI